MGDLAIKDGDSIHIHGIYDMYVILWISMDDMIKLVIHMAFTAFIIWWYLDN